MSKTDKALPITEAGQKFLEAYAEPVVTNTYLKICGLVLAMVSPEFACAVLPGAECRSSTEAADHSVTDSGRGQVMHYDDFRSVPIERVSKYYLARWAEPLLRPQPLLLCSVTSPSR